MADDPTSKRSPGDLTVPTARIHVSQKPAEPEPGAIKVPPALFGSGIHQPPKLGRWGPLVCRDCHRAHPLRKWERGCPHTLQIARNTFDGVLTIIENGALLADRKGIDTTFAKWLLGELTSIRDRWYRKNKGA